MYTQDAVDRIRDSNKLKERIKSALKGTNILFRKNKIYARLNPVAIQQIDYVEQEGATCSEIINSVYAHSTPFARKVSELREQYKADLVSLWVNNIAPDAGERVSGGCATALTNVSPSSKHSQYLSVFDWHRLGDIPFFVPHEIGHNLGARHDWYAEEKYDVPAANRVRPYRYSHGYSVMGEKRCFRTIMAYDDYCYDLGYTAKEKRFPLPLFSDPEKQFKDLDNQQFYYYGVSENAEKPANNRKAINNAAPVVAAYFGPTPTPTPTPTPSPNAVTIQKLFMHVDDWGVLYAMKPSGEVRFIDYAHHYDKFLKIPPGPKITIQENEELYILAFSELHRGQPIRTETSVINGRFFSEEDTARLFKAVRLHETVPFALLSKVNSLDEVLWYFPDIYITQLIQQAETQGSWNAASLVSYERSARMRYYFWYPGRRIPCDTFPCYRERQLWSHDERLYLFKLDKTALRR